MGREVELKLAIPKRALPALRRHPLISACPPLGRAVVLENVYYDTAELALKAQRIGLRTRRQARHWLQTVKAATVSTGGLTSRPEWEQPFSGNFDFDGIDDDAVRKVLMRHADALLPVFSTRFRRETRVFEPDAETRILIMIDDGSVLAGDRHEPIHEVELELEHGQPSDLLQLAARLATDLPLMPDDRSKAERGYRLHLGTQPEPVRAEPSPIDAAMSPLDAFRALAFSCLRQWQANATVAAEQEAPEFIHQLRVSQRRLRSLMRLFELVLPADFVATWSARLRDNANRFGDARDLDVLDAELLQPVLTTTDRESEQLALLRQHVADARQTARSDAIGALDMGEQGRLLLTLMEDLVALPSNDLIGAADLRSFAALQLEHLRKRARKRLSAAADRRPSHLHALRLAFKQLRYGLEFFHPLLPAKFATAYLRALVRTQTELGFIQDVDVARERFAGWAAQRPDLGTAVAYVCGWHGPRYARMTQRALKEAPALLKASATPWATLRRRTSRSRP